MRVLLILMFIPSWISAASFFPSDYQSSRSRFEALIDLVDETQFKKESGEFKVDSPNINDDDLKVNWVLLNPLKPTKKVILINCGTHGIESHVACGFLLEQFEKVIREGSEVAYLFIHALNPYGFKHSRRVTENNVDLNRNFIIKRDHFEDPNTAYPEVEVFLNRPNPARDDFFFNLDHFMYSLFYVAKMGTNHFRQAVVQGQYTYPVGLFYGGAELEPQGKWLLEWLPKILSSYEEVLALDYHTGYGARGELHLFGSSLLRPDLKNDLQGIFGSKIIDWGDAKDFYQTLGDYTDFLVQILPAKRVMPMTFEFGTLDSQTTLGSLKSLKIMRLENQLFHWKAMGEMDSKDIKNKFHEMFFPSDPKWEIMVREQHQDVLNLALENFSKSGKK